MPGATTAGKAVCANERSVGATVTVELAVLFPGMGSVPVSLTDKEVFVMLVPAGVAAFTATTIENAVLVVPEAIAALAVHVIVPVPPTAGALAAGHVHPVAAVADTNVVFAGVLCVRVAPYDDVVPLFTTLSV